MSQFLFANNATSTLAAGIGTGSTTLQLATGSGALFPNPGAGQVFPVTLQDALTQTRIEICYCTAKSGNNLTVVRGQEGTTPQTYSVGDLVNLYPTAGMYAAFAQLPLPGRQPLLADTTFYVSTTGSNSNNGLTSGTAWATIQYALNYIAANYDGGGNVGTIQLGGGTYAAASVTQGFTGFSKVAINGDVANPTSYTVSGSGGPSIQCNSGEITVQGILVSGGTVGLAAGGDGTIRYNSMAFGACSVAHVQSATGGLVVGSGTNTVYNPAPSHILKQAGGVYIGGSTIAFAANVNFSNGLFQGDAPGTIFAVNVVYTGTSTGAFYNLSYGAYLWTQGASTPSGFSAGSTGTSPNQGYFS